MFAFPIVCSILLISVTALPPIVLLTPSKSLLSGDDGGFRSEALKVHNKYRKEYNAAPLKLDQELNKLAHAHAEKLANSDQFYVSNNGFRQNLWSHRGELLPLAKDCDYAIKNWYTGSQAPGRIASSVDPDVLSSNTVTHVGFGVGTSETTGEGYSVVVAFYS